MTSKTVMNRSNYVHFKNPAIYVSYPYESFSLYADFTVISQCNRAQALCTPLPLVVKWADFVGGENMDASG